MAWNRLNAPDYLAMCHLSSYNHIRWLLNYDIVLINSNRNSQFDAGEWITGTTSAFSFELDCCFLANSIREYQCRWWCISSENKSMSQRGILTDPASVMEESLLQHICIQFISLICEALWLKTIVNNQIATVYSIKCHKSRLSSSSVRKSNVNCIP